MNNENVLNANINMKINKRSGSDDIYHNILKETKNVIVNTIVSIFSKALKQGLVPVTWKSVNIILIFKKGTMNIYVNYRLLNLTSLFDEMVKSITRDKFVSYLE